MRVTARFVMSAKTGEVSEIFMDLDTGQVTCDCYIFEGKGYCRHTKAMGSVLEDEDGFFVLTKANCPRSVVDDMRRALERGDANAFRALLVEYGEVQVL